MTLRRYYTDIEDTERMQDATRDALDAIDTERPFGTPTALKKDDYQAQLGEIVLCDPTDGALYITLPKVTKKDIGRHLTVKNYSASVNYVYIRVTDKTNGSIDKNFTQVFLGLAYQVRTFVVIGTDTWMQVAGVGF